MKGPAVLEFSYCLQYVWVLAIGLLLWNKALDWNRRTRMRRQCDRILTVNWHWRLELRRRQSDSRVQCKEKCVWKNDIFRWNEIECGGKRQGKFTKWDSGTPSFGVHQFPTSVLVSNLSLPCTWNGQPSPPFILNASQLCEVSVKVYVAVTGLN